MDDGGDGMSTAMPEPTGYEVIGTSQVTTPMQLTPSLVRTLVPIIVGYLVSLAARHGWHLNDDNASALITAGVSFVYYAVVRVLEVHCNEQMGWLLGLAKAPAYSPAEPPASAPDVVIDPTRAPQ